MSNNSELLRAVKDVYAGAQPEPEQFDDGHNNDFEPHYAMRNRPTPLVRLNRMVGNGVVGLYMAAWGGVDGVNLSQRVLPLLWLQVWSRSILIRLLESWRLVYTMT